jgi:glycerol uptake facilitator-like aquaporin
MAIDERWKWTDLVFYWLVQLCGALIGVALAHVLFELPIIQMAPNTRSGLSQALSEVAATFVLLAAIIGANRWQPTQTPIVVGLVIVAGYWWTASTSFANPAVTLARAFTDSFAGIRLVDVPAFIAAQFLGAVLAFFVFRWLLGPKKL